MLPLHTGSQVSTGQCTDGFCPSNSRSIRWQVFVPKIHFWPSEFVSTRFSACDCVSNICKEDAALSSRFSSFKFRTPKCVRGAFHDLCESPSIQLGLEQVSEISTSSSNFRLSTPVPSDSPSPAFSSLNVWDEAKFCLKIADKRRTVYLAELADCPERLEVLQFFNLWWSTQTSTLIVLFT